MIHERSARLTILVYPALVLKQSVRLVVNRRHVRALTRIKFLLFLFLSDGVL